MAPHFPTWGLALHTNTLNEQIKTFQASRCNLGGGWGCVRPSKCSFVPAMMNRHNIGVVWGPYTPLTAPKNYIHLLGGLLPIHTLHWRGSQGLMWGTRGPFLPVAVMVGYGCVGQCWLLEANVRSINQQQSRQHRQLLNHVDVLTTSLWTIYTSLQ